MKPTTESTDGNRFPSLDIARAALLAEIRTEFPDFDEVPDLIVSAWNARLINCTAWHNDNAPSFIRAGTDGKIFIQVDYLAESQRGSAYWSPGEPIPERFIAADMDGAGEGGNPRQVPRR